jgi:molecular chaperone DnaJ
VSVETIDGPTIMKIPPGTQGGQVFRLKGKGVPRRSGKGRGDHYVKVRIKIPEDLGPAEEKLIRELDRFTGMKNTTRTGIS